MSGFTPILQELVERVPGAIGAIFVDWDGEAVSQFATSLPELEIQIVGAQWGVVWTQTLKALRRAGLGGPVELMVDGTNGSVVVRQVTENYYVVLSLRRGTHLAKALSELDRGVAALRAEM
ncbi:MAG TPA: hypothetical protein VH877_04915 [Polyangia bacterium]|jgi:predicted regulator of Ras-like GTPase activity (Roadblock/LC7/MglB family)|nr:hypothetical protein [Polyangia bacterium]